MKKSNFLEYLTGLKTKLYEVNNVDQGYFYWQGKLIDIVMDLFRYYNLPDTLPEEEIEKRLIITGYCGIIKHPTEGIIACDSFPFDYDIYGRYLKLNFTNPYKGFNVNGFIPGNKLIGKDCEIIYNNSIEKYINIPRPLTDNFFQTICRYARTLADIEASFNLDLITNRNPYIAVSPTTQIRDSWLGIFRSLKRGALSVVVDDDFLKDSKTLKNKDIVAGYITELLETRSTVIKNFMEEIGIFSNDDKKERLIVGEMEQENQNVKIFLYSMLKSRQIGVEKINKLYNLNVSVELRKELYNEEKIEDINPIGEGE